MQPKGVPTITEPLPGGSAGSAVTLRPFSTGEMGVPAGFLERIDQPLAKLRGLWRGARKNFAFWTPCPIFFVAHPTAGNILIDTGLPAGVTHDVKAAVGATAARMYGLRATEEQPLPARLKQLGLAADEIDVVVMTHLHVDHAGSLDALKDCVVVVAKDEWRSAHASKPALRGYVTSQYAADHDFRLVDFEAEAATGHASFERTFDLFGDGSVVLVSTPGHTYGHMSVLLRLRGRQCLIAGDAIYTQRSLEGVLPLILADEHKFKRSVGEIKAFQVQAPDALVIAGHDAEQFAQLEDAY